MVHLHVHSHYSLLEGTASVRQLVARAVEHGMQALALTDTAAMHGVVPFYQAARDAGVRPILGAQFGGCVVLARDREGYAQLCEMTTRVRLDPDTAAGFPDRGAWPFAFGDTNLFVLTHHRRAALEFQRHGLSPLVAVTHYGGGASHYRAEGMVRFARQHGLRPVAVRPVYFLDPAHYNVHQVLSAIRLNTTVDSLPPDGIARPEDAFLAPRAFERLYASWPETLDVAEWVAEECDVALPLGTPLFPEIALPDGETAFSWLWKQTFEGLKRRYRPLTPRVIDRVRYELDIINRQGFAPYFLIVADIVRFARGRGIPVVGRGSAANSVVAYALEITRADPFKYDLYFERFMNLERKDCPDIDLDLCWRRRDEVLDYVYATYGAERVATICTMNTFRARAAVREVAKAHGFTGREIGPIAKRLPRYGAEDLRHTLKHLPECRHINPDEEPLSEVLAVSEFIDRYPRHLSMHPCGVVIAPERLTRYVPLQRAARGYVVTQYDMHPIEDLGLIKMDLLGHRSLTVIDDTVKAVRENRGIEVDLEPPPDGDPLTGEIIRAGRTLACFQIESPAMRGLLRKVGANDLKTLIQCIALVRPGASGSGMKQHFIDRHHGREPVEYLHPAMEQVLGDTYGVMVYQEDVLKVAHAVAGMNLTEADALRRIMSKKLSHRAMARQMQRFMDRAREQGVAEPVAQEVWELIANFAAYAYCKAHAATYGELAYQCVYLKAHYPTEFFAAVLSNRGGFYAPYAYLEEAKRMGVEVRPPDVNRSDYGYTPEDDALRMGLVEIRGLAREAIDALLETREQGGPFVNLADFHARTGIGRADAEALFQAGAFDGFGQPRPVQLWHLKLLYRGEGNAWARRGQTPLLEARDAEDTPVLPDYSVKRRTDMEWRALGMLTGTHPLRYSLPGLLEHAIIASSDLARHEGAVATMAGWMITERRLAARDGGGVMKFITLEDTEGVFEAVLFPETYQTYGHLLTTHGPYVVTGEVQKESDAYTLVVQHLECASVDNAVRWLVAEGQSFYFSGR